MAFSLDDLRGVMSAVILLTFFALFAWVAIGGRDRFRAAADLPFADDEAGSGNTDAEEQPR